MFLFFHFGCCLSYCINIHCVRIEGLSVVWRCLSSLSCSVPGEGSSLTLSVPLWWWIIAYFSFQHLEKKPTVLVFLGCLCPRVEVIQQVIEDTFFGESCG